ncbi:membrane protein DedA, SNARE-associated domain [Seinonella peptonophila]|uniref:Membrane protein DedA, SNARE-associated domain n=1 Tax=Seinonella peptonophila TaxID=112248 RepID=A0A1M4SP85_9BACL|nr:DedA family protein [Seinonella peptonophila]SHE33979.1 membrane protein DedA, SNARE-associated domain [Seinonella peptonophila]
MSLIDLVEQLFKQYGYFVLLIGLPLDAIALPIPPGNTTLTYTGYLAYKGVFDWLPAIVAAYFGSIIGMTITYWIGYTIGLPIVERYGKWIFIKPATLERTRNAYHKHGNKLFLISYFSPGIRQFIGYFVGIIRVPFSTFALYAYTGAGIWVTFFFLIGYLFGPQWQQVFLLIEQYLKYIFIGIGLLLVGLISWRLYIWLKQRSNKLDRESGS